MNQKTSKVYGIVSIVLSVLICPVGLIMGIIGIICCKGTAGKKMSKVAIIIAAVLIVIGAISGVLAALRGGIQPLVG